MKNIVLGITGSIAAYKVASLANELVKKSYDCHVIMTAAAKKFIGEETLRTLTKNFVYSDIFDSYNEKVVSHIELAKNANLMIIAPCTANSIAKFAYGLADDMLSACVLAKRKHTPIIIAPAMNSAMYENEITQKNISSLKERGFVFAEPKESLLACGDFGKGALADISTILQMAEDLLL